MKYNQTMSDALREVSEFSEGPEQLDEVSLLGLVGNTIYRALDNLLNPVDLSSTS